MFTENANRIFNRVIEEYHRWDDVDRPVENPYEPGTIDHLLYHKNWIDTVQWHLEDIIRDPQIDPVAALAIKRRIDKSNQERTDMVEYVDSYLLDKYLSLIHIFHLLVFIALINTVVSLYYYLLVVKAMYITPNDAPVAPFRSDRYTRISLALCMAGVLLLGVVSAVYDGINAFAFGL